MKIDVKTIGPVTLVEMSGDIDGRTAAEVQEQILLLVRPGGRILLDMGRVGYMSSAGLRMLLTTYRQVYYNKGQIALAGISKELEDTMFMTGFLRFFTAYDTVEAGLAALT